MQIFLEPLNQGCHEDGGAFGVRGIRHLSVRLEYFQYRRPHHHLVFIQQLMVCCLEIISFVFGVLSLVEPGSHWIPCCIRKRRCIEVKQL